MARFSIPGSSAYASMKGGIDVFTRFLAKELAARKITAVSVAPGAISTDFGDGENKSEMKQNLISGATALGGVGATGFGFASGDGFWTTGFFSAGVLATSGTTVSVVGSYDLAIASRARCF